MLNKFNIPSMKKVSIIIATLLFSVFIMSANAEKSGGEVPKSVSISGKVINKTNQEALAGALVKIAGTDIEVYTDFDGEFSINGIVPDTYKLTCSMISYSDIVEEVEVDGKTENVEIELQNISSDPSAR